MFYIEFHETTIPPVKVSFYAVNALPSNYLNNYWFNIRPKQIGYDESNDNNKTTMESEMLLNNTKWYIYHNWCISIS